MKGQDVSLNTDASFPLQIKGAVFPSGSDGGSFVDDFRAMLIVGSIEINVTYALSAELRDRLKGELIHAAEGRTQWGGL